MNARQRTIEFNKLYRPVGGSNCTALATNKRSRRGRAGEARGSVKVTRVRWTRVHETEAERMNKLEAQSGRSRREKKIRESGRGQRRGEECGGGVQGPTRREERASESRQRTGIKGPGDRLLGTAASSSSSSQQRPPSERGRCAARALEDRIIIFLRGAEANDEGTRGEGGPAKQRLATKQGRKRTESRGQTDTHTHRQRDRPTDSQPEIVCCVFLPSPVSHLVPAQFSPAHLSSFQFFPEPEPESLLLLLARPGPAPLSILGSFSPLRPADMASFRLL
ncbi:hypothetical protein Mp_3g19800 [Marchantia polymorpha subsp. ruderalis]|uniref:Uncharacterized protein n=2 Tax=Marchantia polymorpha TaxID=3197 RepID=A0AAF6B2P6_MARPO|nr:hypothetical protein MARPO_0049s0054 [Marchantia polymorpha]BBN06280.1 hypothetical protein Mp_3g19800 [Marchantia polymorpha subsp. ruderalis]|eukprot:PTQ38763.1 hypothetical protein MARPO_0049s0054 [Marchantia polymorpha]